MKLSGQTASKSVNFTSDEVNDLSVDITYPISEVLILNLNVWLPT